MIDSAVADFPDPDSPTSATVSPFLMSNEMRSTASVVRPPALNAIDKSLTVSNGSVVMSMRSPERFARIEGVADRLADENQQRQHDRDREEPGKAKPRSLDVGLALRQQLAERRRAGWQAETEEVERGQGHYRRRQDERQERHGRNHRVRKQMPVHDGGVGNAERPRGLDVFEIAAAQKFRTNEANERHPGEQ